jgi:hypothetical protein
MLKTYYISIYVWGIGFACGMGSGSTTHAKPDNCTSIIYSRLRPII